MTRALAVFRFELGYQLARASTRVYFVIFLGFAMAVAYTFLLDARRDGYFFNAPIITSAVTIVASMVALLIAAAVAGDAATRDTDTRLDALIYTTPLRKSAYLGGRLLGAFAVTALLLLAVPLGLLVSTASVEPQVLGPFRAGSYLASYFVFAVPNAFVATAVLFSMAALTRRALSAYAGAVAVFLTSVISSTFLAGKMGDWTLGKLLDPLGFTTLREFWRSLNPLQKNTMGITMDGALLSNRLLWLAVGIVFFTIAFARFRLECGGSAAAFTRRGAAAPPPFKAAAEPSHSISVPHARRVFGFETRMRQLFAITAKSLRELVTGKGWLLMPLAAFGFVFSAAEILEVDLGTPGTATTARVAHLLGAGELLRVIALLIVISAGELVWRERDARINAINDVTPVPEWLSLLGKFLALGLMLAITQTIFIAAGVGVQASLGHFDFELPLYVKILFGFQLTELLLFAALAMVLHVLINQKYVANVTVFLLWIGLDMARELGVRHRMLLYGSGPSWSYSQISGFGPQVEAWTWFAAYWTGWALLFALITYLFWMRGEERGLRMRLMLARRRLTAWPAAFGAVALAIIIGTGGFVFYNTNVLNRYYTDDDLEARRAEYERRYGRYASLPQPALASTKLQVDFYPERGAATIRGTYRLDNRGTTPIDAIHVVANSAVETKDIAFDRASKPALADDDYGYRIYALDRPLQPTESITMHWTVVSQPRGFTNSGRNPSVVGNGAWIQHRADSPHGQRQWMPFVGYQPSRELDAPYARKRYGLPERPSMRKLEDVAGRYDRRGREKIQLETIIGTAASQTGVAPGDLRRSWIENGRRYFHYVTDAPIANSYAIYSAQYAAHRARWNGVAIEILHHPPHTRNLERMVRSVRASLDYHTKHYGPYPHKQLRLVEYPSSGSGLGLTSFPGMIEYSEGFALVRVEDDARNIDFPFAVMAHEMGHQWWGHQVVPALVEGAGLLSESLAWYSALLVVEETYGREHFLRLHDVMRAEYLAPHQTREVPLSRTADRMAAYRIGPFAMYAMREAVGTDRVNAALRNLLATFDPYRPPYPTALDLIAELRAVTPPQRHAFIHDLFTEITYWDVSAKSVKVDGNRVTLTVDAQKVRSNAMGRETGIPMNDPVEIAVFDAHGKPLSRHRHSFKSGLQTITFDVRGKPARVVLDPDRELLERAPQDNEIMTH